MNRVAQPGALLPTAVAEAVPEQRVGQLVVGELPGVPPAFVEREAVDRLAAVFAAGGGRPERMKIAVAPETGQACTTAIFYSESPDPGLALFLR
jgi:hypothetical protein